MLGIQCAAYERHVGKVDEVGADAQHPLVRAACALGSHHVGKAATDGVPLQQH